MRGEWDRFVPSWKIDRWYVDSWLAHLICGCCCSPWHALLRLDGRSFLRGAKVMEQNLFRPVSTSSNVQKNMKKFIWFKLWKWRRFAEETKFLTHHIIEISNPIFTRKRGFLTLKIHISPQGTCVIFILWMISKLIPRATKYIKLTERKKSSAKLHSGDYVLCGKWSKNGHLTKEFMKFYIKPYSLLCLSVAKFC
jgi:hypothetical protein